MVEAQAIDVVGEAIGVLFEHGRELPGLYVDECRGLLSREIGLQIQFVGDDDIIEFVEQGELSILGRLLGLLFFDG